MMEKLYTRTSRVENFLHMLFTKHAVSDRLFVGQLPPTIDKRWNSFVLFDVGQGANQGAYYSFSVNVFLYARPLGQLQRKDVKSIDLMEDRLDEAVNACSDEHYKPSVLWRDADYDSTINFHFNVICLQVIAHN